MTPGSSRRIRPAGLPAALTSLTKCVVMGILNVTPDSFSDGGRWATTKAAIARGLELEEEGADIVDVGGESTRPGAGRVEEAEELARVIPVVEALAASGVVVSVDTMRSEVARQAVDAGALLVNDVSGGLADERMFHTIAELGVVYVCGHWPLPPAKPIGPADDVVARVRADLHERVAALLSHSVAPDRIVLDPGLGFGKVGEANIECLRRLDELAQEGFPLLIGASRKSFLSWALADQTPRPIGGRDDATTAVTALVTAAGAWAVRVHNVAAARDAIRIAHFWRAAP